MELSDSINEIKGIGEKTEKVFHKLNIYSISDLIEHYPRDYDVYEGIINICDVKEGDIVAIEAALERSLSTKKVRNLTILNGQVKDHTGMMNLTWFNMPFLKNSLRLGTHSIFRGRIVRKNGILMMEQPAILSKQEFYNRLHVLQPIYPLTNGITNHTISKAVKQVLSYIDLTNDDYLPKKIRKENSLITYNQAIRDIHFPKDRKHMLEARKRVVFDEFFLFTLALNKLKERKGKEKSNYLLNHSKECEELISKLPYQLTNAQLKVWQEIKGDLLTGAVMNRLIQGDVGSGKTILAVLALLITVKNGFQGTFMVPTEVLARQHYESLQELYASYDIKVSLLVGSMTAKEKRETYALIKEHKTDIIVGTHALIQDKVEYNKLALVITDEQHRFGVRQREALSNKGDKPHILVMSATPIPRTLAIILYGDLDISVIDELPANRLPIKNCVVNSNYHKTACRFIENEIKSGRQTYIICPMVEESEVMEAENVIDYTDKLRGELPNDINIEYLHGKMKAKEKNDIMGRFKENQIQVLVSTTVIEVGVNVPNASVMMIENAERFGLAGLHQLRGRVGRGKYQSYCILVSGSSNKETMKRLEILNQSNDGFFIANEDLKLRGPGDMFGIKQSGIMEFKLGDVYNDASVLKIANEAAKSISQVEIEEICIKNPSLGEKIKSYSGDTFL